MTKIDDFISSLDTIIADPTVDDENIYNLLIRKAVAMAAAGQLGGGPGGEATVGLTQTELEESLALVLPALVGGRLPVDVTSLNVTVDNAALEIANDSGNPIPVSYPSLLTRLGTNGDAGSATGSQSAQLRQLNSYFSSLLADYLPFKIGSHVPVTLGTFTYATATSTNATTTVTISAPGSGQTRIIREIHFSTAGAALPTAGIPLTITANGQSYSLDVTNNGPGSIFVNIPGAVNSPVVVTLGAGGASVVNKLVVAYTTV